MRVRENNQRALKHYEWSTFIERCWFKQSKRLTCKRCRMSKRFTLSAYNRKIDEWY